ncbi:hypothetical protein IC006_0330 [Sulfuracidifex tepidarius]|uniref:Uncharacterized protein n=1 Tax=Sulfuracidifex tepidarius TaxID=1294262 RepID=A0A510DS84_9CREN|nr:hypothetical protein IC006_0330 [Sulfuracidifex tepidarius]BBG25809.1 hypothetical protein IC007_0314 [Sulfuracidifex tepidarius]
MARNETRSIHEDSSENFAENIEELNTVEGFLIFSLILIL